MFRWLFRSLFGGLFGGLFLFGAGAVFSLQGVIGSMAFAGSPSLMVADSSRDHLVHLQDLDADGRYDGPGEASIFYDDSSAGPPLSVPTALIATSQELLLLDGGTLDALIALRDLDGDGFAGSLDEVRILYDNSASGPDLAVPISMSRSEDQSIYIADRSTTRRHVLKLQDLDGDGDMDSPDEAIIWLEQASNPQLSPLFLPSAVLTIGKGQVLVADGSSSWIYLCQDQNGDGVVQGIDEARPWFTFGQQNSIVTIDAMERCGDGSIFICDEDMGKILRLEDVDGDGTISEVEVSIFLDGAAPASSVQAPRRLYSLAGGSLLIGEPDQDAIFSAVDIDGDGNANSIDEQQPVYLDGGELLPSVAGISSVPGPLSIEIEQITPPLVDENGGTTLLIEGNGWPAGADVELRIAGVPIPASAPLNTLILATLPPLVQRRSRSDHPHRGTGLCSNPMRWLPFPISCGETSTAVSRSTSPMRSCSSRWMYLPGSPPISCLDAADLDDNGTIQLIDAIFLLDWLFVAGPPPADPYPLPGADPAQNGPGCISN